jgi:hypothetical protein
MRKLTHINSFNLAYVRADLSRNPRAMPPGIFGKESALSFAHHVLNTDNFSKTASKNAERPT